MRRAIWIGRSLAGAILLAVMVFGNSQVTLADSPVSSHADVNIGDDGFHPASVTIAAGGSVTWTNTGQRTHSVIQSPGSSYGLNSGGIGSGSCSPSGAENWKPQVCQTGESFTFTFSMPGSYPYTSATDCLFGNANTGFDCGGGVVNVVSAPSAPPAPSAVPPARQATPTATPLVLQMATVTVSDSGFTPTEVTVTVGGTVMWVNQGSNVHTATTLPGADMPFDTGGIASGQSASFNFVRAGTFVYTSAPDCLNGNSSPTFQCGRFSVVVTTAPPAAAQPSPSATVAPVATPTPTVTPVPAANTIVTIDDTNGFQPAQLVIASGQTVTWVNNGSAVHSVVVNQGDPAKTWWLPLPTATLMLDSGGLGPGQQFSYTFTTPGKFPYHSSTEPIYLTPAAAGGPAIITYQFNGTIIVQ